MVRASAAAVALALALVTLAGPAAAFDVTGTWTGTRKCTLFVVGVKEKNAREGTVEITQDGNLVGFSSNVGSFQVYSGIVNPDAAKPDKGEIALSHCGTNDTVGDATVFDALGRFAVKTKTGKVKATISGITIFTDPSTDQPIFGTCKWKLKRTSDVNPNVTTGCGSGLQAAR